MAAEKSAIKGGGDGIKCRSRKKLGGYWYNPDNGDLDLGSNRRVGKSSNILCVCVF